MRPSRTVSAGVIAALLVTAIVVWPGWPTARSAGVLAPLLPRLPAIVLSLIAVYGLVTIVATAGGMVAVATGLRRTLVRTDATSEAGAALAWLAAFDATALRVLVPPPAAIPGRQTAIPPNSRFDPRAARAEAAHLYYIALARTHCFGALVGLAAFAALGFAASGGGVPYLPAAIPASPAVVVLVGLLLLLVLGRCAVDVTTDPLIAALSRLPWEPADAAPPGGAAEMPPLLAPAFEDVCRALTDAGAQLAAAADTLGMAVRFSADTAKAILRDTRSVAQDAAASGDDSLARLAALQAAIEALTAEMQRLPTPAGTAGEAPAAASRAAAAPELARELSELLQEI